MTRSMTLSLRELMRALVVSIALGFSIVALPVFTTSCTAIPAIATTLLDIANVIRQANVILDGVDQAAHMKGLDPTDMQKWDSAMADCRDALDAVGALANGGHDLTQGQLDAAFAKFGTAWQKLAALASRLGILNHMGALMVGVHRGEKLVTPKAAMPHPVQVRR